MRDFQDDAGGKLNHPGLTSNEIHDLVQLSAAAYDTSFNAGDFDLSIPWTPITATLGTFDTALAGFIKDGYYFESDTYSVAADLPRAIYPGTAQAVVFSNGAGDLALSFRGTAEFGFPFVAGDSGDWGPIGQRAHFAAFDPLFDALDGYIASRSDIDRLLVTGHSLGGAMVERYMEAYPDGTVAGLEYEAVAIASPEASFENDSRVLNIGHDADIVYSIAGFIGDNAVENIYMLFNDGGFFDLGISERWGAQHDVATGYVHTVGTILSSQFYGTTDRSSQVVINYSDQPDDIRDLVDDFFTPDDSQLILGRGADPSTDTLNNIKSGGTLSIDDWLIGGDGDDWLEGFRGDDTLEGDVNDGPFAGGNDTMAGGEGKDLFLGTPEDLNGDEIVDLEVGDRIGVSGATVDEETLEHTETTITFNGDSGFFDLGGTDVSIKAVVPDGAGLKLLDETLPDGGSIIEVVPEDGQDIAFVIDTTGSMGDDIANVKSQATTIIDAIFDPERGLLNSRIAVVGYNDPSTSTILSFTDQPDFEDRKSAALDAINSIRTFGGGDFPEMTFGGLLRALDGRAGEWREDAVARKIILFGDATAKDAALAPRVYELARSLEATVDDRTDIDPESRALSTVALSEAVSMTTFTASETDPTTGVETPIPVQIFTVAIGSNSGTIREFEEIASETGGEDFRATGAADIVETLLEVINLPIYSITAAAASTPEGDTGTSNIEITVRRDISGEEAEVTLSLAGTADDADRSLATTTVTFGVSETEKTVSLTIVGDTAFEEDESVIVSIDGVSVSATIGKRSTTVTITNDDANIPAGTAGDDVIFTPTGGQSFGLLGGTDIVRGPVENFFDDVIDDFGLDDLLLFEGDAIGRDDIAIGAGSAILNVDSTGDGTPDGSITLTGDFSAGDFMAVVDGGNTRVTFDAFLPVLQDRQAVDPSVVNGILNQAFLRGDGTTDFNVTLRDSGAAEFQNVLGVYEIDGSGNIVDTRLLFENATASRGDSVAVTGVEAGHNLGFFIVQNAADWATSLTDGASLSFIDADGGAANTADGADIFLAVDGTAVDELVFHSFDDGMNSDGVQHALSGVEAGGTAITVGFEDLLGGGDSDYEDLIFQVDLFDVIV
jgi:pimeloyl-ACP methyl ester carboxylesterase